MSINFERLYRLVDEIKSLSSDEMKWLANRLKTKDGRDTSHDRARPIKPKPSLSGSAEAKVPEEKKELASVISKLAK